MKEGPVLCLRALSFAYHGREPALSHISVDICRGERIAILGENGAGKSTFFLYINGVLKRQAGHIYYEGAEITDKNIHMLRKKVGIIFQDADSQMIAPSVRAEISFGPMNLKLDRQEVRKRVENAISFMNLEGFEDRPPHCLSGGEKKRVSIADIIAMEPEIYLFDEPTASLDGKHAEQLERILALLHEQGKTLIVSTHDIDFAYRWADRVLVFREGILAADGTPFAIFSGEKLCREVGLKCPTLLRIGKILEEKGLLKENGRAPRTVEELETLLRGE